MVQDNGFLGLMIRPDPRRTPPTIPCLLDSLCRVHDTILWARCMTESKQEMRYAVYHANDFHSRRRFAGFSAIPPAVTVYRASDAKAIPKIIRPFVPLSRIVYQYNVIPASGAEHIAQAAVTPTKRGQH